MIKYMYQFSTKNQRFIYKQKGNTIYNKEQI